MKQRRQDHIKGNIRGKNKPKQQKRPGHTELADPLTNPQAHHMAGAGARAEYAPVIRGAKKEIRASGQRQKDITGWYDQLGDETTQAAAETDASYAAANAALQANLDAAAKTSQASQAQLAGSNADFAKLTGADPSAFAPGVQQRSAASDQRNITSAALHAPIAQAGAAQAGFMRNVGINARHEGIYQRGQEHKRALQIKQDLMAARKERAQKAQANYGEIRQSEIDNQLKRDAFNLEGKQGAAEQSQWQAEQALKEREAGERGRHNRATEEDEGGNGDKADRREGNRNAMAAGRAFIQANGSPKSPREWAGLQAILEDKEEISPVEARYAVAKLKRKTGKKQKQGSNYDPPGGWAS